MENLIGKCDGIRGKANQYPMTPELVMKVGKAVAIIFKNGKDRPKILIGKDTRLSGYIFENALTAGICSMGADVLLVGPMPTPAVAHLTRSLNADASIMISASHNPADDNGIKFCNAQGIKADTKTEDEIEKYALSESISSEHISPDKIGKAYRIDDAQGRYIEYAKSAINSMSLAGIKAVVDCANGAAYSIAPKILKELGVEVTVINNTPNGLNINQGCGSLHLEVVTKEVKKKRADIGISFDGDADRVLFVDEKGEKFDGNFTIALVGKYLNDRNKLNKSTLVGTAMTNLGFDMFCKKEKINLVRTEVGDKYVMAEMIKNGYNFGGEQSGHIIFIDQDKMEGGIAAAAADGIIASLLVLKIMKESGKKLSQLRMFEAVPQLLINVEIKNKRDFANTVSVKKVIEMHKKRLGEESDINVRNSGTQKLCRVTVQGEDAKKVKEAANEIAKVVKQAD